MRASLFVPAFLGLLLLVAGCGTTSQSGARLIGSKTTSEGFDTRLEEKLCEIGYQWDKKRQRVATILPSGDPVPGELNVAEFRLGTESTGEMNRVASVMARPKQPVFRKEYTEDCKDPKTNNWTSCRRVAEVDFTQVRGVSRSDGLKRGEFHAIEQCELMTISLVPEGAGKGVLDARTECIVTRRAWCDLPTVTDEELKERERLIKEREKRAAEDFEKNIEKQKKRRNQ